MGLFDAFKNPLSIGKINNPFTNKDGLGARISDTGLLSTMRWYDPLLFAATGPLAPTIMGAREAGEAVVDEAMKDAVLPESTLDAVPPPPKAPDLTDMALATAARSERDRLSGKRGRRSTFLTGEGAAEIY